MIRVFVFILALFGMSWGQVHYLAPMETKKEWTVFVCLMVLVAIVGTSLILNISLPSPMSGIRAFSEPIGRAILH